MGKRLSFNGQLLEPGDLYLSPGNRAFRYGDGVFETIRIELGTILWLEHHFERLTKSARLLYLNPGTDWSQAHFEKDILSLYFQNHPDNGSARVRYSLFRDDGGLYTPMTNTASHLIESDPIDQPFFALNTKGIEIDLYTDIRKAVNLLSPLKGISAVLYVLASIHKRAEGLGDCLILNQSGHIAEATSSNLFMIKNSRIYTPPLNEGCVDGIMRSIILEILKEQGLEPIEKPIAPKELMGADELFLCNTIQGLRWVYRYRDKTFLNGQTATIMRMLNEKAMTYCQKNNGLS